MKIKRYNIEQLKNYSVVLSPEEQLMLLGGYKYEEGKFGVLVFDDDNNFLRIIRYDDMVINTYSELVDYTLNSDIAQCTLSSGMTCYILQNSNILAQQNSFIDGLTDKMIEGLERYNVDLYVFEKSMKVNGDTVENSHYSSNANLIAMEASGMLSLTSRAHEVVHSFQKNALNQTMDDKDTLNLEYQAYVVSVLFSKGKEEYNEMIDNWAWMNQYIHKEGTNGFYVDKAILNELGNQAVEWYLSNGAASYREKMEAKGLEPILNEDFSYKWEVLFQSLGIKVR